MDVSQAQEARQLRDENTRLIEAEQRLHNQTYSALLKSPKLGLSGELNARSASSRKSVGRIEKAFDLIDSLAGVIVTNLNESTGVLGGEQ
jgi:hypothetical protein